MSGPAVRRRKRVVPMPRLRVVTGWVEALERVDGELKDNGALCYLHRRDCAAPDGVCECAVVQVGPAVRGFWS